MAGVNEVRLIGRLGKAPELRWTPNGVAVVNFSMATSEEWKDKDTGEKREKTEWHRIVAWRKLAEICGEYLKKGSLVWIGGKLETRSWEQDGVKRYTTEIIADKMQMLGDRPQRTSAPDVPPPATQTAEEQGLDPDDIPF